MFKKLLKIGLMSMMMSAMVDTEANAIICPTGYVAVGGSCFPKALFTTGSVIADLLDNVGPLNKHPQIDVDVTSTSGAVMCLNPGSSNQSPGIQLAPVVKTLSYGLLTPIIIQRGNLLPGGVASVTGTSDLSDIEQEGLVEFCPNSNWTTTNTNFLMCDGTITVTFSNDDTARQDTYLCTLSNCLSTTYDPVTFNFQKRTYKCDLQ